MADTTIKVDSAVRDRLALIAAERGATIRDLVTELAHGTPTREELDVRREAAATYLREQVCPSLDAAAAAAGERFWRDLEAGHPPSELGDVAPGWVTRA